MTAMARMALLLWRTERSWFATGIAAAVATVLAGAALLGLAGWFIASCALAGLAGAGLAFNFFPASAAIRFLALTRTASRYGERLLTHDAALRFVAMLRVNLFHGFTRLGASELARWRSAELLHRLTADVEALDNIYLRLILPAATLVTAGAAAALAAAFVSWELAMVPAALLATAASAALATASRTRKHARRREAALQALRVRAIDLAGAQVDLAVAGRLGAQRRSALRAATRMAWSARHLDTADVACGVAISLLGSVALLGAFLLAAHEFRSGRIDGAVLVAVVLVAMALAEVIGPLRRAALAFGRTQLAARRLMPLLSDAHARPHRAPRIMIRRCDPCRFALRDVGFRYAGRSTPVLASFDLDIAPGERIALAGASGSGKSTLLAMLAGLARPTSGTIRADGLLLESLPLGDHLARVGFLAQRTEIFNDTVAANLRLAAPDADDAALWAALQMVELDTKVRTMPRGLSARLGEAGAGLSGGEARRLALARIVLKSPAVWLLDEPTAGLDEALAHRIMDNVMHHARGATVIIATHHAREAHHARRIVRLDPVRRDEIASMGRLPHDMSGHQTAKQ